MKTGYEKCLMFTDSFKFNLVYYFGHKENIGKTLRVEIQWCSCVNCASRAIRPTAYSLYELTTWMAAVKLQPHPLIPIAMSPGGL